MDKNKIASIVSGILVIVLFILFVYDLFQGIINYNPGFWVMIIGFSFVAYKTLRKGESLSRGEWIALIILIGIFFLVFYSYIIAWTF